MLQTQDFSEAIHEDGGGDVESRPPPLFRRQQGVRMQFLQPPCDRHRSMHWQNEPKHRRSKATRLSACVAYRSPFHSAHTSIAGPYPCLEMAADPHTDPLPSFPPVLAAKVYLLRSMMPDLGTMQFL